MSMRQVRLSPSILSADFARLGEVIEATEAAGANYIHVDVMDGRFVPPLTIGPLVVEAIRKHTALPLDVHLMIVEPGRLVPDFISAGANKITVHQEAVTHLHSVVQIIRKLGASPGVALNPATPASALEEILPDLDLVLAMTVNPGYGGQAFIPAVLPKIAKLRAMIDSAGLSTELEVDGGIKATNVGAVISAGADVIVAGSAVYNDSITIAEAVTEMKVNMSASLNGRVS
jgi:ribulose-phosphate 3-epimerase